MEQSKNIMRELEKLFTEAVKDNIAQAPAKVKNQARVTVEFEGKTQVYDCQYAVILPLIREDKGSHMSYFAAGAPNVWEMIDMYNFIEGSALNHMRNEVLRLGLPKDAQEILARYQRSKAHGGN